MANYSFIGEAWEDVSKEAMNFVNLLMRKDDTKRITALEALNHPYIKKYSHKSRVSRYKAVKVLKHLADYKHTTRFQHRSWLYLVTQFVGKVDKRDIE